MFLLRVLLSRFVLSAVPVVTNSALSAPPSSLFLVAVFEAIEEFVNKPIIGKCAFKHFVRQTTLRIPLITFQRIA